MKRHGIRIVICLLLGAVCTVGVAWGFSATVRWWDLHPPLWKPDTTLKELNVVVDPAEVETRYIRGFGYVGGRHVRGHGVYHREYRLATVCTVAAPSRWDRRRTHGTFGEAVASTFFPGTTRSRLTLIGTDNLNALSPSWASTAVEDVIDHAALAGEGDIDVNLNGPDQRATVLGWGWPMRAMWSASILSLEEINLNMFKPADLPPAVVRSGIVLPRTDKEADPIEVYFGHARALPLGVIWGGFAINTVFYGAIAWAALFLPGIFRRSWRYRRGQCEACGYLLHGQPEVCSECGATVRHRPQGPPTPRQPPRADLS